MGQLIRLFGVIAGFVLVVMIGIFGFTMGTKGPVLDRESKAFADKVVPEIAKAWDYKVLTKYADPALIKIAPKEKMKSVCVDFLNAFGKMKKYEGSKGEAIVNAKIHVDLLKGRVFNWTVTAKYECTIKCSKRDAVVMLVLHQSGDKWAITGFNVNYL